MAFLDAVGVCKQSGCEAIAIHVGNSFTIVARTELLRDFDMSVFAVTDADAVRGLLRQSLTAARDVERLQWLANVIDRKLSRTLPLEELIAFFCGQPASEISVLQLPSASATPEAFLSEAARPTRTRLASVAETHQIEAAQSVFQMTIAGLTPALRARLRAYTAPSSILLMATVFVAIVAMGSSPPWSGIIVATLWVLIGWQALSIARMLGEAVATYLDGNLKGCARHLADIITTIAEAFMMLLIGLAGRLVRAAARVPQAPRIAPTAHQQSTTPSGEAIVLGESEYFRALSQVFPSQYVDRLAHIVDSIGREAAAQAMEDPQFVAALRASQWKLAGTLFHGAAAKIARHIGGIPPGWTITAEETIQAGSRVDLVLRGPAGEIAIIDWKTTGVSALRSIAHLDRYAGIVKAKSPLSRLTELRSASWLDYLRPLLGEAGIAL